MSIISEDGTGVAGAEMYGTISDISAYWTARPHIAIAATWAGATDATKEGAAREAAAFMDASFGSTYIGQRVDYTQGLEWPRNDGYDDDGGAIALTDAKGVELPALPTQLLAAQAELSARAISARLAADVSNAERVKSEKVGEIETEYFDGGATIWKSYGSVTGILGPLLAGDPSTGATWYWR